MPRTARWARCGGVYNFALKKRIDTSLPPYNPTSAIDWNKEERRNTGMGAADLPDWYAQLCALPNPVRRAFHMTMLLSGSRPDALRRARWEHVDRERRTLHIPSPKGGVKKAFDVPLSRPMLVCLRWARLAGRKVHEVNARTWTFPSDAPGGHIAETKEKRDRPAGEVGRRPSPDLPHRGAGSRAKRAWTFIY